MKIKKDGKLLLKILSAFAAIVLWFAITYTEDPITSQYLPDIDIVFEGEEQLHNRGFIVVNKDKLPAFSAQIQGNRSGVIASIGAVSAQLDVSQIAAAGTNTVSVKYNYPIQRVTLLKTKVKEVPIEIEKLVERKIPVRIETENDDKNTEFITHAQTAEKTVSVTGAESVIYKIAYAKATVDVTDITASSEQNSMYKLYDSKGNVLPETNILSKSAYALLVENTVYKKQTVPVRIVLTEEMSEDYALRVKDQSVTQIFVGVADGTEISELTVVFDGKTTEENPEQELTIVPPEGVYVPEDDLKLSAKCELVPKVERELELVPTTVSPLGITDHEALAKKVVFTPEKLKVRVKGTEELLTAGNIKAVVDIKDIMSGGEAVLPVMFETKEDIRVLGEYSVTAALKKE